MPNLAEQLRIARVNRMKKRAADAWHRAHCERCRVADPLAHIFESLRGKAGELVELVPGEPLPTAH